ncbi:MAG: M20/M25/M40 family metallo-hydrolase [Lachnospiraceae bacterium]|nr:M20/M25/M40 family metallo-hydrolase [Lachnospiraceae bacterium]
MKQIQEIFDYVDAHKEEFLEDLQTICACQSVAGNQEGLHDAKNFILKTMQETGIERQEIPVEDGNSMVYGYLKGEKDRTVLFYNHYDVVEPGKAENWKSNAPFSLTRQDGMLYARGVSDDKGPLFSRIHAIKAILNTVGTLPVNVKFLAEGDEETASPSMFRYQSEHMEEFRDMTKADVCLWENGRRDRNGHPWARFGVRGACGFDLRCTTCNTDLHGRMGSSVPSASWRLVWALATLKDPNEHVLIEGFYDDVQELTQTEEDILEKFPYEEEEIKKKLQLKEFLLGVTGDELKRRIYMEPSLSICGLEAGELYNGPRGIVPHTAWARISMYLVANQDPEKIHRQIREHLDRHGFSDVEVEYRGGTYPVKTSTELPVRGMLERAAAKVYDKPLVIEPTQLGSGPAIAFRRAWKDLPIVGIGPGNTGSNHHAPDENLTEEDYICAIKHVIAFMYELREE